VGGVRRQARHDSGSARIGDVRRETKLIALLEGGSGERSMALSKGWTDTIDKALTDAAWDDYDTLLTTEIGDYNARFGFGLDWKLFKALIWTESGAASAAWKARAMQIGNVGDPAWAVVKAGRENTGKVMSAAVRKAIDDGTSIDEPRFNIKVGLVYAVTKLSTFGTVVSDKTMLTYEVVGGDSLERIAGKVGTTKENLLANNPAAANMIKPKDKLSYQKASIQPTACTATSALLQSRYNGNGDHTYAQKLEYCLGVMRAVKR
jgi:LysM repeat protein